ncbi:MAG: hypothetical protein AAFO89_01095 [Planctomycetota bacterium]
MKKALLVAIAAGTIASTSAGQIEFYRVTTDDINDFRDTSGTNPLLVGSLIFSMAFDGEDVYIAGFNNFNDPWNQIGQIIDYTDTGPNRSGLIDFNDPFNVNTSSRRATPQFRGYTGLDWVPGAGLIGVWDGGSGGPGAIVTYDTETQQTPILNGVSQNDRGLGAVAWDPGPDGNGYDQDGDGISDGPAPSLLLTFVDPRGPIGVVRPDLSTAIGAGIYAPDPVAPEVQGPILEFIPGTTDRGGLGGTFWRGFDFSPDGRFIVAVADADLVIAERDLMNNVTNRIVIESSPGTPGDAPFIVGQQSTFVDNYDGQDFVVFNKRLSTAGGQSLLGNVELFDTAGNQLSYSLFDENGDPLSLPDGPGLYDFSWHEPTQTLALLDSGTHIIHFFQPQPATGGDRLCADQNGDDQVLPNDFNAWVLNFNGGDLRADTNQNGVLEPGDFNSWILAFNQGANGPICTP